MHALCPPNHPLRKTTAVRRLHFSSAFTTAGSLEKAIVSAKPDLVIPGDDVSLHHLHQLYEKCLRGSREASLVQSSVERSFGSRESFAILRSRARFIEVAGEEGVRVPKTEVINDIEDLKKWSRRNGFPAVLKANGTSGGEGVIRVNNLSEAQQGFSFLQAPPLLARATKRAVMDRDKTLLWPSLTRRKFVVNAQAFVSGREATSLIACWDGKVLACLHFEVVQKRSDNGPATVLRLIENHEMSAAATLIVRRLGLSGIHGLDFMLQEKTGDAYLIEVNPRATQVGHLTLGKHRDLPAALYAAITRTSLKPSPAVTDKTTIALFPNEWMRDPASNFLRTAYHDVPWGEPGLVQVAIERAQRTRESDLAATYKRTMTWALTFLRRNCSPVVNPAVVVSCAAAKNEETAS